MMGKRRLAVHAFRITFRAWCREATDFPREVADALAQVVSDKTEADYAKGGLFDKPWRPN
jgi:hypothetical protein